ncbi:MAG TPA: hypothetical protein VG167_11395 [Verrucomicrobiae bacterium]|nr:hypothetical protein [Verrucomicrobiae bacterium]
MVNHKEHREHKDFAGKGFVFLVFVIFVLFVVHFFGEHLVNHKEHREHKDLPEDLPEKGLCFWFCGLCASSFGGPVVILCGSHFANGRLALRGRFLEKGPLQMQRKPHEGY